MWIVPLTQDDSCVSRNLAYTVYSCHLLSDCMGTVDPEEASRITLDLCDDLFIMQVAHQQNQRVCSCGLTQGTLTTGLLG